MNKTDVWKYIPNADFWGIVEGKEILEDLIYASAQLISASYPKLFYLDLSSAIVDCPLTMNDYYEVIEFGLLSGVTSDLGYVVKYPIDENIVSIPELWSQSDPDGAIYFEDVNYVVSGGYIHFGTEIEETWLAPKIIRDHRGLYNNFGYLAGLDNELSTEAYRWKIYFTMLAKVFGPKVDRIRASVGGFYDIPASHHTDTVQGITGTLGTGYTIDINDIAHEIPANIPLAVARGDSVILGEALSDAVVVSDSRMSTFWSDYNDGDLDTIFHFNQSLASVQNYTPVSGSTVSYESSPFDYAMLVPSGTTLVYGNRINYKHYTNVDIINGASSIVTNTAEFIEDGYGIDGEIEIIAGTTDLGVFNISAVDSETELEVDKLLTQTDSGVTINVVDKFVFDPRAGGVFMCVKESMTFSGGTVHYLVNSNNVSANSLSLTRDVSDQFTFSIVDNGSNAYSSSLSPVWLSGGYIGLACAWSGGTIYTYAYDGTYDASGLLSDETAATLPTLLSDFTIGSRYDGTLHGDMWIDELKITSGRKPSAVEIEDWFRTNLPFEYDNPNMFHIKINRNLNAILYTELVLVVLVGGRCLVTYGILMS